MNVKYIIYPASIFNDPIFEVPVSLWFFGFMLGNARSGGVDRWKSLFKTFLWNFRTFFFGGQAEIN